MKKVFNLLLIGVFANFSLFAQSMIEGGISNEAGESLIAATITLVNEQNVQLNKTIQTDEYGYFVIEDLTDGNYQLVVEHVDYESLAIHNIVFPRDTDQVLGLEMEASRTFKEVEVRVVRNMPDDSTGEL